MANDIDKQSATPIAPRIQWYLDVETKYDLAPVPAGLEPQLVKTALEQKLTPAASAEELDKLLRLALLYDARGAAPAFAELLTGREESAEEIQRAGTALAALAWLAADAEARPRATRAFDGLLQRASVLEHRELLLPPCDALTPGPALAAFQRWLQAGIDELEETIAAAKKQKQEARDEELLRDACREFLVGPVAALAAAAAKRAELDGLADDAARIAPLAELYLGELKELNTWAGYRLVQIARRGDAAAPVAAAFLALAADLPAPPAEPASAAADDDEDAEPDEAAEDRLEQALLRARCLRAAVFFGGTLKEEQASWLQTQEDAGTDLLALRPDWHYAGQPDR